MDEFSEILISKVSAHRYLYDNQHKEYKNLIAKEQAWAKIGEELKMSPMKVKTRWKNLRDSYVKYRNQLNKVTDDASKEAINNRFSKWTSRPYLSFLDETLSRRSQSMAQVPTKLESKSPPAKRTRGMLDDESIRESKRIDLSIVKKNGQSKLRSILHEEQPNASEDSNDSSESKITTIEIQNTKPENCLVFSNTNGIVASEKNNTLIPKSTNEGEGDAVDLLFSSYAKTFRVLSLMQQINVKVEMAKLFASAELRSQHTK
uniref:Transcription factor Adf-1 n=1 Tax=Ceratitis capitata TaxID=7213 RepID=W8BQJ5_CERCA